MPSRTDDPPRTRPQVATPTEPASPLTVSPSAGPAVQNSDDHLLTQESFQAILSTNQRAGRWEPADEIEVRAIFGAVILDFTQAELPPSGIIEINALSFCGSVEIIVPDGAEVELDGTPIVGSIEQKLRKKGMGEKIRERILGESDDDLPPPPQTAEPPYFRIEGQAIFGSIEVKGR